MNAARTIAKEIVSLNKFVDSMMVTQGSHTEIHRENDHDEDANALR